MFSRARSWLPVLILSAYGSSQAGYYAAALAFAGFLAMFPMMLGVVAIVGLRRWSGIARTVGIALRSLRPRSEVVGCVSRGRSW